MSRVVLVTMGMFLAVGWQGASASTINDLTEWTEIEDPPTAGLTSPARDAFSASLRASGAVPSARDIGYASVDGDDVPTSTAGFYFDPASDFEVTVEYDLSIAGLSGAGGIGFGVGEDAAGENSAGVGLGFANVGLGNLLLYGAASRVDNADQGETLFGPTGSLQGRFSVAYDAASGDVTVGVAPGSPAGLRTQFSEVIPAVQNQWNDAPLLVSFFLRSQAVSLTSPPITVPAMSAGTVDAVFSDLRVVSGTPIRIPEPTTVGLGVLATLALPGVRRCR